MSERELFYLKSLSLKEQIILAIKRAVLSFITPFTTFDEIGNYPDLIGPLLMLIISIAVSLILRILLLGNVNIFIYSANETLKLPQIKTENNTLNIILVNRTNIVSLFSIKSFGLQTNSMLMSSIFSISAVMMYWLLAFLMIFFITKIFGGMTYALGSATGYYIFSNIIASVVNSLGIIYFESEFNLIKMYVPNLKANILIQQIIFSSILISMKVISSSLTMTLTALSLFANLWNIVVLIALFNGSTKMSIKSSIIAGILGYILIMFTYQFMLQILYPFFATVKI